MSELWQPVVGYEGLYEVSDQGRVRSLPRRGTTGKILSQGKDQGYWRVWLYKDKQRKDIRVHQLVAAAFLGPKPDGLVTLHGANGADDNSLSNLSYGTQQQNHHDKWRDGTQQVGEAHGCAILTEKQVLEIRRLAGPRNKAKLARQYGVCKGTIYAIVNRQTWAHLG